MRFLGIAVNGDERAIFWVGCFLIGAVLNWQGTFEQRLSKVFCLIFKIISKLGFILVV